MQRRAALLVALGGFAGALSRHAVTIALPEPFPWGTLAVNVVGAFALGLFVYGTRERWRASDATRLVVSTGFMSSFTTYSTFASETAVLEPTLAAANVVGNYALGFSAVLLAREVVRWRS
ncbi:MAG: fluoride efflux transporter FluC [Halobacteriota archaeon]|uniref:fluoride efflux transporter FluC n=1 Tax=Natronomonas sp. TaxID=2184060 RepID=UPI0039747450